LPSSDIAYRHCSPEGRWWDPTHLKPYTRYVTCLNHDVMKDLNVINAINTAGYSLSIVLLVLATAIFAYFR